MQEVFVGRQPIFDRRLRLFAYELLYRPGLSNEAGPVDSEKAAAQVIFSVFTEFGLDDLVGEALGFINLSRNLILSESSLPFPTDKVVLEVLETVEVDSALIEALRTLSMQGFLIALDDFEYREGLGRLLEIVDFVKLDARAMDRDEIRRHLKLITPYNVRLVAEKVETREEFEFFRSSGFHYFQGFFLSRPEVVRERSIPPSRLNVLRLLIKLQDQNTELDELEKIITQDVSLSYKLLRYINSAYFSLPKRLSSIRHAVVYLGTAAIRNWVTLMALAQVEDKPHELLKVALIRGRMCDELARLAGHENRDSFFTVGLLSALDALLDIPLEQVVSLLPLSDEINKALLEKSGPAGQALKCTLAYEFGKWEDVSFPALEESRIRDAFLNSIQWSDRVVRELWSAVS